MMTKNVHYSQHPKPVMVFPIAQTGRCRVDFPVHITELTAMEAFTAETIADETETNETQYIEAEQTSTVWVADVYSIETRYCSGIQEEINDNYDEWLEMAKAEDEPQPTIQDLVEALNIMTELVIGGE